MTAEKPYTADDVELLRSYLPAVRVLDLQVALHAVAPSIAARVREPLEAVVARLRAEVVDLREKVEYWVDERDIEIERGDEARAQLAAVAAVLDNRHGECRNCLETTCSCWVRELRAVLASPDAGATSQFREAHEDAKRRNAEIPPHARMVITDPALSAHSPDAEAAHDAEAVENDG